MADKTLALYTSSSSTYNLEEIPQAINLVPENTFVREEANAIMMASLAIMPPLLSRASGGTSCGPLQGPRHRKVAPSLDRCPHQNRLWGPTASKEKGPESATKSVHVTPSGNTIFSPSYTVVGIQKPDGGCGKGLMRKPGKGKGPTIPVEKCVSKETAGS